MSQPPGLAPIELLVLSFLLVSGEKGANRTKIQKALGPLVDHRWAVSELAERLDAILAQLASTGLVNRIERGKGKTRSVDFALSDAGRERTLRTFGLKALPPKTTWSQVLAKYLSAVALGLPVPEGAAAKTFASAGGFKAAVLRSLHDLPVRESPTLTQATDAFLWKLLGRETTEKFDLKGVKEFLILRSLGEGHPRPRKIDVDPLIVRDLRPRNSKAPELRAAVVRRWLEGALSAAREVAPAPAEASNGTPATSLNDEEFARRVVAAARGASTGRFGENKVFIAHVWRALRDAPEFRGMDLDSFKRRLTEANQARRLDLSRADLVEAMNPEDVRESEASHLGARYHFIRT